MGVLDEEGPILMVGSHDERGWRNDWHWEFRNWGEPGPKHVREIPPGWWGAGRRPSGPWRALFADGTESMFEVRGAVFDSTGPHWMPKTDFPPQPESAIELERALVTNPPVPACRFAGIPTDSAEGAAVAVRIAEAFGTLERYEAEERLLSAPEYGRESVQEAMLPILWAAADGDPPPIQIEHVQRSHCPVAGRYVYFVRASRCYPRSPRNGHGEHTISVLQGWLTASEGELPVWLRRDVQIGNSAGVERRISPLGVFEHDGKSFAIARDNARTETNYVVYEITGDSMRRVHTAYVSSC